MSDLFLNEVSEGIKSSERRMEGFSQTQLDYIKELIPDRSAFENASPLAKEYIINAIDLRIMELTGNSMKPMDSNKEIKALLEPIMSYIKPELLEAPTDSVQIEQISDAMCKIESLRYEKWKELSFDQHMEVLNKLEHVIAKIEHRNPCPIYAEKLDENNLGKFSRKGKYMVINSEYINSNSFKDHSEVLDTLIHEGRHAYQDYNLTEREVHIRQDEVEKWRENLYETGYLDFKTYGFELYSKQPVEADAFAFASNVLKRFNEKIA